jgi:hypothetical protein
MLRLSKVPTLLFALALFRIAPAEGNAQVPLSPRSLGMGGAMIASARGQEAIFLNPANLGLAESPRWSVALVGVSAAAELQGIEIGELADLIQYDDLSDAERDDLFGEIPASGVRLEMDVRAPVASAQIGSFGFGVAYLTLGGHSLSRDLVELLLYGYEEGRTDYAVDDTRGDRASLWDFAVAYGTSTGPVSWGVTGHFLLGGTLVRTFMTDPRIDLAGRDIDVDYVGLRSSGGTGVAFDLGAAYQLRRDLTLSGVVTSAYSRLDWSDDFRIRQLELGREDFDNNEGIRDFLTRYERSERALGPEDEELIGASPEQFLRVESHLPTTATLGVAWQPAERTDLVASYSEDLTNGRLGGDWTRRAGIGVEQRFWHLAARLGAASDLDGEQMITGGLSLGPVNLGAARISGDREGLSSSGWIGVFGLGMRTP